MLFSRTLGVALLLAAAIGLTACGESEQGRGQNAAAPVASSASLAGEIPDAIRTQGTLKVAADATLVAIIGVRTVRFIDLLGRP